MSSVIRPLVKVAAVATLASLGIVVLRGYSSKDSVAAVDRRVADRTQSAEQPQLASEHRPDPKTAADADDVRDVDLGKVSEGTELRHTFSIRNTTARPLKVVGVKKSCGCESVNVKEGTVIGPGENLEVTYALSKYGVPERKGHLVITTDSDDESLRLIDLRLHAYVQPTVWTTPSEIQLVADDPSPSEQLLRVETVVAGLLDSFQEVATNRGNVIVRLKEKSADALTFGVSVAPEAPWGTSYDLIYLTFDNHEKPSLNVRAQIRKGHALAIIPATLKLPALDGSQPLVRKVRILCPAATTAPFRITNVDSPDGILVGQIPAEARHTFDVNLTFTKPSAIRSAPGGQYVVFHTDPPGAVTLTLRHDAPSPAAERNLP